MRRLVRRTKMIEHASWMTFRQVGKFIESFSIPNIKVRINPYDKNMFTQIVEMQLLYFYFLSILIKNKKYISPMMEQRTNVIFRYKIGLAGSGQIINAYAKLHPTKKHGRVRQQLQPISPQKPQNMISILLPKKFQVKLPNDQIIKHINSKVLSYSQINGEVNSLQNSKCLRFQGLRRSGSDAKYGILKKGGQRTTSVTQITMGKHIKMVVKDLNLQQGAKVFLSISRKGSASSSLLQIQKGDLVRTVHAVTLRWASILYIELQRQSKLLKLTNSTRTLVLVDWRK